MTSEETIKPKEHKDYRSWLIWQLVHRNPTVTMDFRERELSQALIPNEFRDKTGTSKVVIELYDYIMQWDDYDKGIIELIKSEGLLYNPDLDGITHINVYSKGATKLGRGLSNFAPIPFIHPVDGKCASVEGYWYYLKTGRLYPHLKELIGFKAKEEGRKYDIVTIDDFIPQICQAITCKIMQNENLKEDVKNSTLPFTHYYFYGKTTRKAIPMDDKDKWLIEHLESIRRQLKEDVPKEV